MFLLCSNIIFALYLQFEIQVSASVGESFRIVQREIITQAKSQ